MGSGGTKGNGVYIRRSYLYGFAIVVVVVIVVVGLMCAYLPNRSSGQLNDNPKTTTAATQPVIPTEASGPWPGRLPTDVIPESYELYLKPYINDDDLDGTHTRFTFDGRVTIRLSCKKATNRITLHILKIVVNSVSLSKNGEDIFDGWETEDDYEFLHVNLKRDLVVGEEYDLFIDYLGELTDGLTGFYRSKYTDSTGHNSWFATTQMQPTDARRALPCYDEPDFKAVFNTTIEHRSHMAALSNGIEINTEDVDGRWKRTTFKPTPPVSTYLLAFVVGEFDYLETTTTNGVRYRTWSRPDAVNTTRYALDIGSQIITYFEDYFGIRFPLEKQDMIAVPDLSFGAMENWGLITYRETRMLYDPAIHSAINKRTVATVISHELAHQWFGNLVTPEWWEDLWLNEGFATYVTYLGVNFTEPDWGMMEQFLIIDLHPALALDSLGTSHPVLVPVDAPSEINEIFDGISYKKGGSILRMLNNFLNEDVFRAGLHNYLTEFQFENALSDDLWRALTAADVGKGNNDVKKIMDTWIRQMGYPLVTFTRKDASTVAATQEHYLNNPAAGVDPRYDDLGYEWWVNLEYTHKSQLSFDSPDSVWMEPGQQNFEFLLTGSVLAEDWYLVNTYQHGFYRVNYDEENWQRLIQQLIDGHTVFPTENRAQLIDDAFHLASTGNLSHEIALGLTRYLGMEGDYLPWAATLGYTDYIADMFRVSDGYGDLELYMRDLITPLYVSLGWIDSSNVLEQFTRNNAIRQACNYGVQDCLNKASQLFSQYMANPDQPNPISNNLKITVYCTAIREGGQEEWNFGWNQFVSISDAFEKTNWLTALGCSKEPWILNRYLRYAIADDSEVRLPEIPILIGSVASNHVGGPLVWNFVRSNWDKIFDLYGGTLFFAKFMTSVTNNFNTKQELNEMIAFSEGRDFGSATRAYQQAIERTITNIQWMSNYEEVITTWLTDALSI